MKRTSVDMVFKPFPERKLYWESKCHDNVGAQERIKLLEAENGSLTVKYNKLLEMYKELDGKNAKLVHEVNTVNASFEKIAERSTMKLGKIPQMESTLQNLQQQIEKSQAKCHQLKNIERGNEITINHLRQENIALTQQLEDQKQSQKEDIERGNEITINHLRQENIALTQQLEDLERARKEDIIETIETKKSQLLEWQQHSKSLEGQCEELLADNEKLREKVKTLIVIANEKTKACEEYKSIGDTYGALLQEVQTTNEEQERELVDLYEKKKSMKRELKNLRKSDIEKDEKIQKLVHNLRHAKQHGKCVKCGGSFLSKNGSKKSGNRKKKNDKDKENARKKKKTKRIGKKRGSSLIILNKRAIRV